MAQRDALGERMKLYEMEHAGRKLLPLIPMLARIDGRSFSRFTRGLRRPYDPGLTNLFIETTKYLVRETNAVSAYTQSDEISLMWYNANPKSEPLFGARSQKLMSILSSMTTGYFVKHVTQYLPVAYADKYPQFDARVWNVPTTTEAANYFLWRELDATKNSLSMAAAEYYSHSELMHKNGSQKHDMLHARGINWNDYPASFKRGTYIQSRTYDHMFTPEEIQQLPPTHPAQANPALVVTRRQSEILDIPPLLKIANRVGVLFRKEKPETIEEPTYDTTDTRQPVGDSQ